MAKDDHELTLQLFFLKVTAKGLVAVRPLAWASAICVLCVALACLPLIVRALAAVDAGAFLTTLRDWRIFTL